MQTAKSGLKENAHSDFLLRAPRGKNCQAVLPWELGRTGFWWSLFPAWR
jgi:hypothetical protein